MFLTCKYSIMNVNLQNILENKYILENNTIFCFKKVFKIKKTILFVKTK